MWVALFKQSQELLLKCKCVYCPEGDVVKKKKIIDNTQSWKLPPGPRADVGQEHKFAEWTGRREEGQGKKGPERSRKGQHEYSSIAD